MFHPRMLSLDVPHMYVRIGLRGVLDDWMIPFLSSYRTSQGPSVYVSSTLMMPRVSPGRIVLPVKKSQKSRATRNIFSYITQWCWDCIQPFDFLENTRLVSLISPPPRHSSHYVPSRHGLIYHPCSHHRHFLTVSGESRPKFTKQWASPPWYLSFPPNHGFCDMFSSF